MRPNRTEMRAAKSTKNDREAEPPETPEPGCRALSHSLDDGEVAEDVRVLAALEVDTRYEALRIVAEAEGGACPCEVEPALGVSQGAVSQALSRLHAAGLVSRRKVGRWRYYEATPRAERLLETLDDVREAGR